MRPLSRILTKDPTRKLKIPKNLRPKDKHVLNWDQLWLILASTCRRDRLLLMLEMTASLRPSELFALRWKSFDSRNTLSITETVYRGVIRPFGKTNKSLGKVHLPEGLAHELIIWKTECADSSPKAFIFSNADGGVMRVDNYRERVLKPLAERLGIPRLNFQILRRTMATQAQTMGSVKDIQAHRGTPRQTLLPTSTCRSYLKAFSRWSAPSTACLLRAQRKIPVLSLCNKMQQRPSLGPTLNY